MRLIFLLLTTVFLGGCLSSTKRAKTEYIEKSSDSEPKKKSDSSSISENNNYHAGSSPHNYQVDSHSEKLRINNGDNSHSKKISGFLSTEDIRSYKIRLPAGNSWVGQPKKASTNNLPVKNTNSICKEDIKLGKLDKLGKHHTPPALSPSGLLPDQLPF
jgi:hypothetical protein